MFKRISSIEKVCFFALGGYGMAFAVSITKHGIALAGKFKKIETDIVKPKREETENFSSIFPI
jgi:hypothetical protein